MNGDSIIVSGVEAEYTDIGKRNAWGLVYQKIGRECNAYPYTCKEAKKLENKPLNRYRDVNPYDHSRIILKRCDQDYINANLVKMDRANRRYILTQGPLALTVSHFWLMVWEQRSKAILMLNKIIEKNETKCHWYWPRAVGEDSRIVLPDVRLTVEQIKEDDFNYYSTRVFRIVDMETSDSREVIQFHYTTWPDFGVPSSPNAFLEFLRRVRASGALDPDAGPAVVHCSAGIGRSGTFCLVDSCLVIIEKEGIDKVNVQQILMEMRRDRMGLIQTPDQLRFSYQAIIEGAKRLDPNYKEPEQEESIYSSEVESEEEAPAPPPRTESLARAPARPLPSTPVDVSVVTGRAQRRSRDSTPDGSLPPSPAPGAAADGSPATSADDEDDETAPGSGEVVETLRRRKNRELAERVSAIKRRAHEAERWHELKRFKSEANTKKEPED